MKRLSAKDPQFGRLLEEALSFESETSLQVVDTVEQIIRRIRREGDAALVSLTRELDGWVPGSAAGLEIPLSECRAALESLAPDLRAALEQAAERIRSYHAHQKQPDWQYEDEQGNILGQQITPLDRAGLYVPGGKAAYPSSVLMNAIPAKVAGVPELIMVVPVFAVGRAQAVAALAWGTETIPRVDKIVGPGNIYVATAKRLVFGQVGIDMIAGPSEICVVWDGSTPVDWIAMDLFSQAEHDEQAQAIAITTAPGLADQLEEAIRRLLPTLTRHAVVRASLAGRGLIIEADGVDEALEVVNRIAPEHLELSFVGAADHLRKVRHAGAIFVGRNTAEALGDYCAGPNHVLPTSGTARFSSPLGVYDFQKRSSIICVSDRGAQQIGPVASVLARAEGLEAHARSAEYRFGREDGE